jgi:hypothetical protein
VIAVTEQNDRYRGDRQDLRRTKKTRAGRVFGRVQRTVSGALGLGSPQLRNNWQRVSTALAANERRGEGSDNNERYDDEAEICNGLEGGEKEVVEAVNVLAGGN